MQILCFLLYSDLWVCKYRQLLHIFQRRGVDPQASYDKLGCPLLATPCRQYGAVAGRNSFWCVINYKINTILTISTTIKLKCVTETSTRTTQRKERQFNPKWRYTIGNGNEKLKINWQACSLGFVFYRIFKCCHIYSYLILPYFFVASARGLIRVLNILQRWVAK